jgi:hypothetical protein
MRFDLAAALLSATYSQPLQMADVAKALDLVIVKARQLGKLDLANYMVEIQKALLLRYPHRKFSGLPRE